MQVLGAGLLALCAAGSAAAAETWYVGADAAVASNVTQEGHHSGRVYLGYTLGTAQLLGMQQVHALEVQLYQFNFRRVYGGGAYTWVQHVRAKGGAVAWASALKMSDAVALNSRLGVSYTEATTRDYPQKNTKLGPLASVGASYALNDSVKLRADVNYMQLQTGYKNDIDHAVLSTGIALSF